MDTINVANAIEDKIHELDKAKLLLKERGDHKAESSANYDKAIAVTLIGLKNGKSYTLDGVSIADPPASIMDKLSRGICWKEKLEMEKAEAGYKSLITGIEILESQLNGWQSINRHLSEK